MHIFRLDPQKFGAFKRKTTLKSLVLFPAYIVIAYIIQQNSPQKESDSNLLYYLTGTLFITGAISLYNTRKQLGKMEALYRLKLNETHIILQQFRFNEIQILKTEIAGIYALPKGGFKLTAREVQKSLTIHPCIEREDELKTLLEGFAPIQPLPANQKQKALFQYAMAILVVLGMMAAFFIENPWIAVPGGLLAAGYMVYAFLLIRKSKMIGNEIKQKSWWLILPLMALLAAVYAKLF